MSNKSPVISPISKFPTTAEIKSAMEVASRTIDGSDYLLSRVKVLADNSKFLNKSPELKTNIIGAIEKFAEHVRFKLTMSSQPWSGQQIEVSDLKNMQKNIAESAAKDLTGKLADVKLDYAVSEDGHYIRGYSSDNEELDTDSVDSLDKLFNAWLASKDYLIKGGYLYNAEDTTLSEQTRIGADEVKQLMDEGGLQEFMADKGIKADMELREYPGEEKEAQAQHKEESIARKESSASDKSASEIEPDQAPQTSSGTTSSR